MLINKTIIEETLIVDLIVAIKRKKELSTITNEFVRDILMEYFKQNPKSISSIKNPKSTVYKTVLKQVRSKLRRSYGLFRTEEDAKTREALLNNLKKNPKAYAIQILETHSSTKERAKDYERIYKNIFTITKKPKRLLDIGCGINPFSFPLMKTKNLIYHAYDISEYEINQIQQYFDIIHSDSFQGYASTLNALHWEQLLHVPQADLAFLFKMTDVLDRGNGHKVTEQVLQSIPAKHVVLSFATKTMSGKKMNAPKRKWVEWLCKRLRYPYQTFMTDNEIFYVITK